jgi:hypothetical protein
VFYNVEGAAGSRRASRCDEYKFSSSADVLHFSNPLNTTHPNPALTFSNPMSSDHSDIMDKEIEEIEEIHGAEQVDGILDPNEPKEWTP